MSQPARPADVARSTDLDGSPERPGSVAAEPSGAPSGRRNWGIWPGLAVCLLVGGLSYLSGVVVNGLSAMLVAVVIGALWRNLAPVPDVLEPGIDFSAKHVLRAGVVLLGLQLSLPTILALGPGVLVIVVCAVTVTFFATLLIGRLLRMDSQLTMLIAAGFSICGAAAVAGVQGVVQAAREKVAAAVALVVLFGTIMIPLMPLIVHGLGLAAGNSGTLIGGSVHEVAQVVAAAGIAGGEAVLAVAVPIKLARVVMLAPMVFGISLVQRRRGTAAPSGAPAKRPPLIPLFVVGFLAMILIATTGWVPQGVQDVVKVIQSFLLASAMFALGLGVKVKHLIKLGPKPLLLGLLSTLVVFGVVSGGVALGLGAQV